MGGPHSAATWLRVDREAEPSLAEQIVMGLRERILDGELRESERLPSSRALAEALGVARSVGGRAYEELLGEGCLDARAGSGTIVATGIVLAPGEHPRTFEDRGPATAWSAASNERHPRDASTKTPDPAAPIELRTGHPFAASPAPEGWRRAGGGGGR